MKIIETKLPGVLVIKPKIFNDSRGLFMDIYQRDSYREAGIEYEFVQDSLSKSKKNVLRGLHYQKTKPQGKIVTCTLGSVFDVVVDIKPSSKTFGNYISLNLTENNHKQVWIPSGYAHGFCVLSEVASIQYKLTDFYDPCDASGVVWSDPDLDIAWPIKNPIVSEKDKTLGLLSAIQK